MSSEAVTIILTLGGMLIMLGLVSLGGGDDEDDRIFASRQGRENNGQNTDIEETE